MSDTPEKKHSWAKFQARPVAPRPLTERPATGGLAPKLGKAAESVEPTAPVVAATDNPLTAGEATGGAVAGAGPLIAPTPGGVAVPATPAIPARSAAAQIISLAPGAPPISPPVPRAPVQSALAPTPSPTTTPSPAAGKALARDFTGRGQRDKKPAGAGAVPPAGSATAAPLAGGAKSVTPRPPQTASSPAAPTSGASGKQPSATPAKAGGGSPAKPATPAARAGERTGSAISDTKRAPEARAATPGEKGRSTPPIAAGPAAAAMPTTAEERETATASAPITAELADTLSQLDDFQTAPGWPGASQRRARPPGQGRLAWIALAARDSVRNYRETGRRLAAWWDQWRRSASCRVLLAFLAIYGVLALMRAPSEVAVAQSRRAAEVAYLSEFLRDYAKAGGLVLAEKPHGGTELYPRGVVIKGDLLTTFARTPVGETFSYTATTPETNPLNGFYIFPSIYAGGHYFALERKFNFALYRFTFLIRKDTEVTGTLLMAKVE